LPSKGEYWGHNGVEDSWNQAVTAGKDQTVSRYYFETWRWQGGDAYAKTSGYTVDKILPAGDGPGKTSKTIYLSKGGRRNPKGKQQQRESPRKNCNEGEKG